MHSLRTYLYNVAGIINQFENKNSLYVSKQNSQQTTMTHYYTQQINNLRLQWNSARLFDQIKIAKFVMAIAIINSVFSDNGGAMFVKNSPNDCIGLLCNSQI